ncbi:MAG: hypothetical protein ACSNEK_02375 [Parachlamydiaceae bacterium]
MADNNIDSSNSNNFLPFLTPPKLPDDQTTDDLAQTQGTRKQSGVSGEAGIETALEQLAGARSQSAQVLGKDQLTNSVNATTQFNEKFNLGNAFSSQDISNLQSDSPTLPAAQGNFNINTVAKEVSGNPWLSNSFMTTLTANLMEVARMKMSQQSLMGGIVAKLYNVIGDLGRALGDLAMQKAEKEAEMHMWQATVAFISFGITLAAGALSIGGSIASNVAGGVKGSAANKTPTDASTAAGGSPIGAKSNIAGGIGGRTTPSPTANPPTAAKTTTTTSTSTTASTTGIGGHRGVSASKPTIGSANQRSSPFRSDNSALQGSTEGVPRSRVQANQASAAQPDAPKSTVPSKGSFSRNQASGESGAPNQSWVKGTKWKSAKPTDGAQPTETATPINRKADHVMTGAEIATHLGTTFTHGSSQLGNAADNLVQMVFKPQIGAIERDEKRTETAKQIAQQALQSAMDDMKSAGQDFDGVMQALQKIQDENSRAHSLGRG